MTGLAAPKCRVVVRAGVWLFAFTLFSSAWLKAAAPGPAAHALLWTGLDFGHRVFVVDVWNFFEAVVAGGLLCLGRRAVQLCGAVLAALLTLMHVLGMAWGSENCGCFGELVVPDGVTLVLLLLGGASCAAFARAETAPTSVGRWMMVGPMLAAALIVVPVYSRPAPKVEPEQELLAAVGAGEEDALYILGSHGCKHCFAELLDLAKARQSGVRYVLVVRKSDRNPRGRDAQFGWLSLASIPDDLWWQLVLEGPPTFVRVKSGAVGEPSRSWR